MVVNRWMRDGAESSLPHDWFQRAATAAAMLAALLTLPSLGAGLLLDDFGLKALVRGTGGVSGSPFDLFRLVDGGSEHTQAMIDSGLLPWWTYNGVKGAFWRPLASLTHWLDFTLWPDLPAAMHLQSVFWYVLLVTAAGCLYRRAMGAVIPAALALILYSMDDAHATPVGWLANRSSVLAAASGALALYAHHRWRGEGWRAGAALAPMLFFVSLLCKEEGVGVFGFLLAYAALLDNGRPLKRLLALAPCVLVILAWRICWTHMGYGVANIGGYIDPLQEPLRFAAQLPGRLLLIVTGLFGAPPPITAILLTGNGLARLFVFAGAFVALLALAFLSLLRRSREARFWTLGTMLSAVPACATIPDDRLLLIPGIGAMALVAMFLTDVWSAAGSGCARHAAIRGMAAVLAIVHLVLAPVGLAARSSAPLGPRWLQERLYIAHSLGPMIATRDLVVVNPPVSIFFMASPLKWAAENSPVPRRLRVLTSSLFCDVSVTRTGAKTLLVRPEAGYLAFEYDRLFRSDRHPLRLGDVVRLPGMEARVVSLLPDGRPGHVAFTFEERLEHPSLLWKQWSAGRFVAFEPPAVGETVLLRGYPGGFAGFVRAVP